MAQIQTPTGHTLFVDDAVLSSFRSPPQPLPDLAPPQPQIAPPLPPTGPVGGAELGPPDITTDLVPPPAQPEQIPSPAPSPVPASPTASGAATQPLAVPAPSAQSPTAAQQADQEATAIESAPSTFSGSEQVGREGLSDQSRANILAGDIEAQKAEAKAAELARVQKAQADLDRKREVERVVEQNEIAKRQAEIDRATDTWAKYKIDEGRRWKNLGTGRKIAAGIAVAMSAMGDVLMKRSGPNMVLQMIHDSIKDDVTAQLREREGLKEVAGTRKNSLDEYLKVTGKKEDAFALKMAEELKRSAAELERQAAQFAAPEAKARAMLASGQLKQQAGQYLNGVATSRYTRDKDEREFAETKRHTRVMEGQGAAGLGLQAQGLALQKMGLDLQREKMQVERESEAAKLAAQGRLKEAEDVRQFGVGTLKQKDGTPLLAGDKETRAKLDKKIYVAGQINDIINEVLEIRDRVGGESAFFNSDDRQKLKVLQDQLAILKKDGTEGLSSENDMKLIAGSIGAADVASFRARSAGLLEGRERTTAALNAELRANKYNGEAISFPNRFIKTPEQKAEEKAFIETIKKPSISRDEAMKQALEIARERAKSRGATTGPGGRFDPATSVEMVKEADAASATYKEITPNQAARLQQYGMIAMTPGPAGDSALRMLKKAAEQGETQAIRNIAAAELQKINLSPRQPRRDEKGVTLAVP